MSKQTTNKDSEQIRQFKKAARELGCEDNEERFKDALRAVGKKKPQHRGASTRASAKR
jgi:hypothetical protein